MLLLLNLTKRSGDLVEFSFGVHKVSSSGILAGQVVDPQCKKIVHPCAYIGALARICLLLNNAFSASSMLLPAPSSAVCWEDRMLTPNYVKGRGRRIVMKGAVEIGIG